MYYPAGFIESWDRGIEKICQACDADGSPGPEYTINPGDIMIKFTVSEDRIVRGPNGTVKSKVSEGQILELLAEDPAYTYQDIADRLGVGRKVVSGRIKKLKESRKPLF